MERLTMMTLALAGFAGSACTQELSPDPGVEPNTQNGEQRRQTHDHA